ncbi:37269_t:CDS:2 [Gigaspora margarita]|uniref:37269_t:CDS:1 n=1 Tax=Gigaspora margarita TaxID=4874 RepID=A0ABM8W319_GIGMA|nr:37269_t:CDS:2 [Gigaspora margarita]
MPCYIDTIVKVNQVDFSVDEGCSSKRVKVVDKKNDDVEYVDSYHSEENIKCRQNVCENKVGTGYHKESNKDKEKEIRPTVHNTRQRTK